MRQPGLRVGRRLSSLNGVLLADRLIEHIFPPGTPRDAFQMRTAKHIHQQLIPFRF